jgi:alpha-2-macroglobulin-like protein
MKKKFFIAAWLLFTIFPIIVDAQDYASRKEKIYIQTNHALYSVGDAIYFKAYVVRAENNTPSQISNIVYAELISPSGSIAQKGNFQVTDGFAEGSFLFPAEAPGGIYKIRAYTSWMQNEKESSFFVKEITLQKVLAPRILMKLDFPEKGYGAGDQVKADFSMRNLQDQPIRNYAGKFTVFISGNALLTDNFSTNAEGKAMILFTLPSPLTVNDGLLNVTIQYESFTESISRSIPIVLNNIDLQFMPEGGTLVEGLSSWVAFKSLNENGKAADIKGEVRDEQGKTVATFNSYHFGMGKFLFTPQAGHVYKAYITSPTGIATAYEMPVASLNGILMHLEKQNHTITVQLNASVNMDVKLRGTVRNTTWYTTNIELKKGINSFTIDENLFPAGIAQFSLVAANELPLAERLFFLHEERQLNVKLRFDKPSYAPREKVKLSILTTDPEGNPVPSNFSISVVDDKRWTFADDRQDHILSWLLLSSELKGKIEEPQFYFKKEEPKAIPALDLLMLTHGYRYFDFIEYVVREGMLKYLPDQDNIVSGRVQDLNGNPVQARMFLMNNVYGGRAMEYTTGADGAFFFSDLASNSSYYLFAQPLVNSGKVVINILQNGLGYNPAKARALNMLVSKPKAFEGIGISPLPADRNKELAAKRMGVVPFNNRQSALNEVVVVGFGTQRKANLTAAVSVVRADEIGVTAQLSNALQGKVAGLQISQSGNFLQTPSLRLRGSSTVTGNHEPLFILNGVPVDGLSLNTLNPNDIDNITVLKDGNATALYGYRAAYGAIVIESKKLRRERINLKFKAHNFYTSQQFNTSGISFTPVKRFYAPRYETIKTEERSDFRETIYWNPVVQTNKEGVAEIDFYNSDASTTFRAVAEGIGFNGLPGRTENTYAVQSSLRLDAKIPPYLTVGDKALIPLVIKNNSGQNSTVRIQVVTPADFITGEYKRNYTLAPDSSLQILIPLEARNAGQGQIQFNVSSEFGDETLSLPVSAADKGFPVSLVFSGNKSGKHEFPVSRMVPGTLRTKLQLFSSLEGQLLDGIESMLREPYGCFEQTSSTTYPNVFILKYLKESGRSNPKIERKALDYIQRGYARLIGFETKQDGFEWFGNTPPHEALTAYGLLEFTDMKEFVKVNEKMLQRTKQFLLSRRDGNGGFTIQKKGYDQFASVPDKIATLYILYALTEAGVTKEVETEYRAGVKKAMESKDAYQLALMALAANNMNDRESYLRLMSLMADQPEKGKVETSVVNSRDASLRVETWSLQALALLRANQPDMGRVANLLSKILGEKSYYGYGSTQATVLALKAITAYGRLAGKVAGETEIDFTLNNDRVTSYDSLNSLLQTGNNSFNVRYSKNENAVPYNLEVSYSTFIPPSADKAEIRLSTRLKSDSASAGETVRMDIEVSNTKSALQPMVIAKIGIPAGLSLQPWQLKEFTEKNKCAYYEIFDNYLVFYWMGFAPNETKTLGLDLKAEIPGTYKAKASTVYLYYTPEYKYWAEGTEVTVGSR